ncbi:MAG: hypothetical protein M3Y56_07125, partial [Armatimonadota bacterium]|nr:hypothetical protein [Armatimonadota bacterium]
MRPIAPFAVLFTSILLASPAFAALSVSSTEPSNVFIAGQNVNLQVAGVPAGIPLSIGVHDYEGKAVAGSVVQGNSIHLGRLPRGYYEVIISAGTDNVTTSLVVVPPPVLRKEPALAV